MLYEFVVERIVRTIIAVQAKNEEEAKSKMEARDVISAMDTDQPGWTLVSGPTPVE